MDLQARIDELTTANNQLKTDIKVANGRAERAEQERAAAQENLRAAEAENKRLKKLCADKGVTV